MNRETSAKPIDMGNYLPAQLIILANKITASASQTYRKQFGVGTLEWRILGMVAFRPNQPVARLSELTGFDKAAVSRGLNALHKKKLALFEADQADPRRKTWNLSHTGKALYNQIASEALKRESRLTRGLTNEEKSDYIRLTQKMIANVGRL